MFSNFNDSMMEIVSIQVQVQSPNPKSNSKVQSPSQEYKSKV